MIRLFAAIGIPEDIGESLVRRQQGLPGARWRPIEAFHITLRFVGEVKESVAEDLDAELSVVVGEALTLTLSGVGAFGEGQDMHAVWAGVETTEALKHLAARCETAARRAGLAPDRRAWKPHVTLAYLRRPDPAGVAAWIQGHNLLKSPPFRVTSFGLYSSTLGGEGSRYRLEREYFLSSPVGGGGPRGGWRGRDDELRRTSSGALTGTQRFLQGRRNGVVLQHPERGDRQGHFVRRLQHHLRRGAGLEGLHPARRAQAPAVARLQAREARLRRRQIVADALRERQELGGHHRADGVQANIVRASLAAAVAEESGHRPSRAGLQLAAENVAGVGIVAVAHAVILGLVP